jgi:hypothetical protein
VRVYRVRPESPHPNPPPLAGREARAARGWGLPSRRPSPFPTSRRSRCCRSPI